MLATWVSRVHIESSVEHVLMEMITLMVACYEGNGVQIYEKKCCMNEQMND